ncbi:MAG TPA: nucleotidyl transferase AbiEii/AbiGii toxin family protein [Candidatus Norongarragalinales archaeon]|nr:nucleotidyl transferase AbiEii/AbiGii toxin family protein [Candidatus Norongarragalinales archaeon]
MLDRSDLNKFGPPGFNLGQKEKDYAQHWILSFLSRSGFSGVFKGGTCLQKAFALPRYSEDLDFTLNESALPDFDSLAAFLSSAGFAGISVKTKTTGVSAAAKLRFRGPLYNGTGVSEGTVSMDFSLREKTLLKPDAISINPPYPDLLPYQTLVMNAKEISAEKVRAILTRESARDLFDLYFLLKKNAFPEMAVVQAKLDVYGKKFGFNEFEGRIKAIQKIWKQEMAVLTPNFLEYELVSKEVLKQAKGWK